MVTFTEGTVPAPQSLANAMIKMFGLSNDIELDRGSIAMFLRRYLNVAQCNVGKPKEEKTFPEEWEVYIRRANYIHALCDVYAFDTLIELSVSELKDLYTGRL